MHHHLLIMWRKGFHAYYYQLSLELLVSFSLCVSLLRLFKAFHEDPPSLVAITAASATSFTLCYNLSYIKVLSPPPLFSSFLYVIDSWGFPNIVFDFLGIKFKSSYAGGEGTRRLLWHSKNLLLRQVQFYSIWLIYGMIFWKLM